LISVLQVDYLTPDVAHAVPELVAPEYAQADPAPSAMAGASSLCGRLSPIAVLFVCTARRRLRR
jgi:hypothetical protein